MTWALDQRIVTDPTARHVLLCLANYADKEGRGAFPSASTISDDTGLSLRTIRYKLEQVEQAGAITRGIQAIAAAYITREDRRPVVYDLAMSRGAPVAPRVVPVDPVASHTIPSAIGDVQDGVQPTLDGVQLTTERGALVAPNPSINRPYPIEQKRAPMALVLPDWLPPDLWAKFDAYRRQKSGKGWTPEAIALNLRTLTRLAITGQNVALVINQTIENSWSGLFPVRNGEKDGSAHRGKDGLADQSAAANREHDERERAHS